MKIVWIEREENDCAYETVRDQRRYIGSIYVIDSCDDEEDLWGDDWDDTPEYCNAGPPYDALKVDLYYGDDILLNLLRAALEDSKGRENETKKIN